MIQVQVLFISSNSLFSSDIAEWITNIGHNIILSNVEEDEVVALMHAHHIDVALIDIQLAEAVKGIELGLLMNKLFKVPLVLLSSTDDEHIIKQARQVHPCVLLLSPFRDQQIRVAIEMALESRLEKKEEIVKEPLRQKNQRIKIGADNKILFLKSGNQFKRVQLNDILWLEAEGNYTSIVTRFGTFLYSSVLKNFSEKLPPHLFLRVHRSFIVNINSITGFEENRLLINGKTIPISKNYKKDIFKYFEVI